MFLFLVIGLCFLPRGPDLEWFYKSQFVDNISLQATQTNQIRFFEYSVRTDNLLTLILPLDLWYSKV